MGCVRNPPATKRRGRHPVNDLSAKFVSKVDEARKYWDGNGLILVVQPTGSKSWIQRLTIRGRRRELGLGGFPATSLKQAREQAFANLQEARQGRDPLKEKRSAARVPTFAAAAEKVFEQQAPSWRNQKHSKQWGATLGTYVFPSIGERSVSSVTSADVLEILMAIWHTRPETARRVRGRINAVMEWAVAMEFRPDNPCDRLKRALPRQKDVVKHMRALPYAEVSAAIATVQQSQASLATKLALEFLMLTAARSGEVRGAKWDEIDLDSMTWLIPAERMKAKREHAVPLSRRAVQVLEMARPLANASGLIFPQPARPGSLGHDAVEAPQGARHPGGTTWFQVQFQGLGRRAVRCSGRGDRSRSRAYDPEPNKSRVCAHGLLRSPSAPHGRLGRVPQSNATDLVSCINGS